MMIPQKHNYSIKHIKHIFRIFFILLTVLVFFTGKDSYAQYSCTQGANLNSIVECGPVDDDICRLYGQVNWPTGDPHNTARCCKFSWYGQEDAVKETCTFVNNVTWNIIDTIPSGDRCEIPEGISLENATDYGWVPSDGFAADPNVIYGPCSNGTGVRDQSAGNNVFNYNDCPEGTRCVGTSTAVNTVTYSTSCVFDQVCVDTVYDLVPQCTMNDYPYNEDPTNPPGARGCVDNTTILYDDNPDDTNLGYPGTRTCIDSTCQNCATDSDDDGVSDVGAYCKFEGNYEDLVSCCGASDLECQLNPTNPMPGEGTCQIQEPANMCIEDKLANSEICSEDQNTPIEHPDGTIVEYNQYCMSGKCDLGVCQPKNLPADLHIPCSGGYADFDFECRSCSVDYPYCNTEAPVGFNPDYSYCSTIACRTDLNEGCDIYSQTCCDPFAQTGCCEGFQCVYDAIESTTGCFAIDQNCLNIGATDCRVDGEDLCCTAGDPSLACFDNTCVTVAAGEACTIENACGAYAGCTNPMEMCINQRCIMTSEESNPSCYDGVFAEESFYTGPILDLEDLLSAIFRVLYPIAILIGIAMLIRSGYCFMTSEGNPQKVAECKDSLTSAVVGLLFIMLSIALLRFIINAIFGTDAGF